MSFSILVDGSNLGTSINAMKSNCQESRATFPDTSTMFLRALDTAGVCICECKTKVVVNGESRILGLNLMEISTDLTGPVDMEVEAARILVKDGRITHKIKLVDPSYIKEPSQPKVDWPFIFDIPAAELRIGFKAVCDKIPVKDSSEGIIVTWTGEGLIIEDMSRDKVDVQYGVEELNIRKPYPTKLETMIPIDYIRPMLSTFTKLDRCVVGLGQEIPMSIGGNNKDLTVGIGFLIAPRIIQRS